LACTGTCREFVGILWDFVKKVKKANVSVSSSYDDGSCTLLLLSFATTLMIHCSSPTDDKL